MIKSTALFLLMFFAAPMAQADEFGARFNEAAPAALGEFEAAPEAFAGALDLPTLAQELQAIMPAAGSAMEREIMNYEDPAFGLILNQDLPMPAPILNHLDTGDNAAD